MRVSSAFCVAGWLAIYFAEVRIMLLLKFSALCLFVTLFMFYIFFLLKSIWPLDIGRLATGYGMGAFSYVVSYYLLCCSGSIL